MSRTIKEDVLGLIMEFLEYQEIEKGRLKKTIETYGNNLTLMFHILENQVIKDKKDTYQIQEIKPSHIRQLMKICAKQYNNSKRTRAKKVSILKSFFKFLEEQVYEETDWKNPMRKVSIPSIPRTQPKVPSKEDVDEFFRYINSRKYRNESERLSFLVFFHLTYFTMARIGEVPKIKVGDIDFKKRELSIKGKGAKDRFSFFDEKTSKLIQAYIKIEDLGEEDFLVRNKDHEPITERALSYRMRTILSELDERDGSKRSWTWMTAHKMLRKAPATLLNRMGVLVTDIQRLLGHSNIDTTMHYIGFSKEDLRKGFIDHPLS